MKFTDLNWQSRRELARCKHDWVYLDGDWKEMLSDIMDQDEKDDWIVEYVKYAYDDELDAIKNVWKEKYGGEYPERIIMDKEDYWDQDYANDLNDSLIEIRLEECTVYLKK